MSKRFGKARAHDCVCTYNFTCGPCLRASRLPIDQYTPSIEPHTEPESNNAEWLDGEQ